VAKTLVDDKLWAGVEPRLPAQHSSRWGGKPPVPDRVCFAGILFVLKTGIPWDDSPPGKWAAAA